MTASQSRPTRYAWLSMATALLTIVLKTGAWMLTGSVGLLSDAVESIVNLAGAVFALVMLSYAARPADEGHPFGHGKAEYFSSGFEGMLIIFAAGAILYAAIDRLLHPGPVLGQIGVGLAVSAAASVLNFITARILLHAGRVHESISLEADGRHLMTDVWTSAGVLVGVACVWLTGWMQLDALIAGLVGLNILYTGYSIVRRSFDGLMDSALPEEEMERIKKAMQPFEQEGIVFHALRTRRAAASRFVTVHMLFPGHWTVHCAHCQASKFENAVAKLLPNTTVSTHLESLEDWRSYQELPEVERPALPGHREELRQTCPGRAHCPPNAEEQQ